MGFFPSTYFAKSTGITNVTDKHSPTGLSQVPAGGQSDNGRTKRHDHDKYGTQKMSKHLSPSHPMPYSLKITIIKYGQYLP